MPKSCPSGTIRRKGYTRKTYKKRSGTVVKGGRVPSSCIRDVGKPGKGKRLFTLKKGGLRQYGYSTKDVQEKRHEALVRAMEKGKMSTGLLWKRLNAIEVLNRNTNPKTAEKIKSDMDWLRAKYGVRNE